MSKNPERRKKSDKKDKKDKKNKKNKSENKGDSGRKFVISPVVRFVGLFLILLFSVRFLIEFIKEPQVGFEANMILNMGQILSLPFILIGILIMLIPKKQAN